jgi:hypothetical protein
MLTFVTANIGFLVLTKFCNGAILFMKETLTFNLQCFCRIESFHVSILSI